MELKTVKLYAKWVSLPLAMRNPILSPHGKKLMLKKPVMSVLAQETLWQRDSCNTWQYEFGRCVMLVENTLTA